ncbi:hypothetical protein [Nosocomiicoccus massiliensis]|uniref:DUF3278 domain-containing protein n=1 Tax=Nosocomiicoccus massiliensis TaxID=1232430 RepID=A0AAF0YLV9_9STAP|nr:hypothetical protein [Nosocomiicoccus massiliensis]WOS95859.1 hypothetical protein CJ229_007120 [Nosocomiicoccus massiliensis]
MNTDEIINKKLSFKRITLKKRFKRLCIVIPVLYFILFLTYLINDDVGSLLITVVFYSFINIIIRNMLYVDANKNLNSLDDFDKKRIVFSKKLSDFNDITLMSFALASSLKEFLEFLFKATSFGNICELNIDNLIYNFILPFALLVIVFMFIIVYFRTTFLKDSDSYWYDEEDKEGSK